MRRGFDDSKICLNCDQRTCYYDRRSIGVCPLIRAEKEKTVIRKEQKKNAKRRKS